MSNIQLDAYLFFTGNCKEAMEFYKSVFGGELSIQLMGEVPGEKPEGSKDDSVMHALLSGGDIRLMASDGTRTEAYGVGPITLSLSGTDEAKLTGIFEKLSEGGNITQKLEKMFWGATFGSLTDKFGIDWMVNIEAADKA
jgi:PhnB protein